MLLGSMRCLQALPMVYSLAMPKGVLSFPQSRPPTFEEVQLEIMSVFDAARLKAIALDLLQQQADASQGVCCEHCGIPLHVKLRRPPAPHCLQR